MFKYKLNKARKEGAQTCPATRHAHMIVDDLRSTGAVAKLIRDAGCDPDHMADTIEEVVLSLWQARELLEMHVLSTPKASHLQKDME